MADIPTFTLNNGVAMPGVLFGCFQGPECRETADIEGLHDALAAGYRGLDTANNYNTEAAVGEGVRKTDIPREQLFITTKLPSTMHHDVKASFEDSLKQLGTYIDLYLMHWPQGKKEDGTVYDGPPDGPTFNDVWEEMEKLLETKQVRAIGVSNFSHKTLGQLLQTAKVTPAVCQVEGHPFHPDFAFMKFCHSKGIHMSYYSPLGNGQTVLKDADLVEIGDAHGVSAGQVCLAWALANGVSVNPRSTNAERIKGNITLPKLTDAEVKRINDIHKNDEKRHSRLCLQPYNKEDNTASGWSLEKLGWDVGFKHA
ncbi:Aldo/keto reductase [Tilletiopsis washingtonensis]|uniref:Aldo/keto reductase n=1 Tax=Tilletiopsis washingtonensis TaxID=58919 RepID=A0A316Z3G5_9BASI|nr:Aldo/keto reductase [Tilletiopsis washingtonensis]PWN95498.1 Aldo/keto reductase [Tilletiopsis washingtonensis]